MSKNDQTVTQNSDKGRRAETQCPWCKSREAVIKNGVFYCSRCSYECDVSVPPKIKVIGWTTASDHDYVDYECTSFPSAVCDAIIREIREKKYDFEWASHQSQQLPCTPVINNGYKVCCGARTWGWIMEEALGKPGWDIIYAKCLIDDSVYPEKYVDYQQIVPFEIES